MKEVNAKDIEIIEKKKGIDPVENDNSLEEAAPRKQVNDLLSSIESNISYRKNVGCQGTSILCLIFLLIGLSVYGFHLYSGFTCGMTKCPGTAFFFVFGLLNTLLFLYLIICWKKLVKKRITDLKEEEKDTDDNNNDNNNSKTEQDKKEEGNESNKEDEKEIPQKVENDTDTAKEKKEKNVKSKTKLQITKVKNIYNNFFEFRGKYYLYTLYGSEILEKTSQTYNYIYIYTCILPYWVTILFCILFIIDSGILVKTMYNSLFGTRTIISTGERNSQLARDVVFDLICGVTPLLLPYLMYDIPTNINEAIFILLVPSLSWFSKVHSLFEEVLFRNIDVLLLKVEEQESVSINRNRISMYRLSISEKEEKMQSKYFIKPVRQILLFIGIVHVLFFASVFFVQLSHGINLRKHDETCRKQYQNDNDNINVANNNNTTTSKSYHNIWSNNGCQVKTPFCYSVFVPTCNCAYLSLDSVNVPTLPDNIVYDMTSLKRVEVINCNLTTLPKNMENLKLMAFVDLSYNKLTEFNIDVKEWIYLIRLNFQFNNISKYNMESVWRHPALKYLLASGNPNFVISNNVEIHMPMLAWLDLRNNSMQLPNKFGKDQFPALLYLYLSGNNINTFPDNFDTLNDNLLDMYIAQCHIYTLPSYLSTFKFLEYFDARDNNISVVDPTFQSIFYDDENDKSKRNDNRQAYFSGNPVCHTDVNLKNSFSCEEMCSNYCNYKKEEVDQGKNGYCFAGCNSEECNYDQGDCNENLQWV